MVAGMQSWKVEVCPEDVTGSWWKYRIWILGVKGKTKF